MMTCPRVGLSRFKAVIFASGILITLSTLMLNSSAPLKSKMKYIMDTSIRLEGYYSSHPVYDDTDHPERNNSCKTTIRPTPDAILRANQVWQVHDENNTGYFVYSAFYDDRRANGNVTYVRTMGLIRVAGPKKGFCQIWYEHGKLPHITEMIVHLSGGGSDFAGSHYAQVMLSCKLPSKLPIPTHVSFTLNPCTNSTILLPIYYSQNKGIYKHDFAICVAISHDTVKPENMMEWAEINRMFGVGAIHIYNGTLTSDLVPVLNYYKREGLVHVHPMPPPVELYTKVGAKFGSPASLNDCMMRYMYEYRYIIVIDFDEVIVGSHADNYTSLLREIDAQHKAGKPWRAYSFMNTLFLHDFEPDNQQPAELDMLRYRRHAKAGPPGWGTKSFIDPRECLSVFNHYCYILFPNTTHPFSTNVDPSIAKSHHYKMCNFSEKKCQELKDSASEDHTLLKYKEYILHQVAEAREKISKGEHL